MSTDTRPRHTAPFGAAAMRQAAQERASQQPQAAAAQQTLPTALGLCAQCLGERKVAEMQMFAALGDQAPTQEALLTLPPVLPALCLVQGTGVCAGHLQVGHQSPILGPNGAPISIGLGPQ